MGEIRNYMCECGYNAEIFAGAGMRGIDIELIKKFFPEEGKFISENRNLVRRYLLKNAIAECDKCKKIFSVSCLEYNIDGEEKVVFKDCPECQSKVVIHGDKDELACPVCKRIMKSDSIGHWD